jgi:hypothetical protein
VIVSYDMLVDVKDVLMAVDFKVVILDESHCIKNSQVGHIRSGVSVQLNKALPTPCHGTIDQYVGLISFKSAQLATTAWAIPASNRDVRTTD